jgi:ankyrin repeat protein
MPKTLPTQPHIDWLKKAAKQRLAELRASDPAARLHQAQLALARDYGFASWRALKSRVDALSLDGQIVTAALAGNVDGLARLLATEPQKLAVTGGPWSRPLLHIAADKGHFDCVNLLLSLGFDVHKRDRTDKATALHWAAAGGHLEIVKRLLAAGADIDGEGDAHTVGVIGWATCFSHVHADVADFLLSHGAKPTLFSAVALGRGDLVRSLVADDPTLLRSRKMSRFEHHRTPLHLAVLKNRPAMVGLLLELGADPRAKDSRGYTPLNLVTAKTDTSIAGTLIAAGADPEEKNMNRFEHIVPVLTVKSVAAAIGYYVDRLGFEKKWEWGTPPTFGCVGRDQIEIFLSEEGQEAPGMSLSIFVQDVDALHESYKKSGAIIRRPPTNFPWGVRGMDVDDLDGHRLRMSGDGGNEHRSGDAGD